MLATGGQGTAPLDPIPVMPGNPVDVGPSTPRSSPDDSPQITSVQPTFLQSDRET